MRIIAHHFGSGIGVKTLPGLRSEEFEGELIYGPRINNGSVGARHKVGCLLMIACV
jgi:hypothetical protein